MSARGRAADGRKYGVIFGKRACRRGRTSTPFCATSAGKRLPIQTVQMKAVGANGKALHEERYVSHLPDVIEPWGDDDRQRMDV